MDETELAYRCALYEIPGVGMKTHSTLVKRFGGGKAAYGAGEVDLEAMVGKKQTQAIITFRKKFDVHKNWERLRQQEVTVLTPEMKTYPTRLKVLAESLPLLYVRGRLPNEAETTISIVGTRRPTGYGREVTRSLGLILAQAQAVIVSGLAFGVDAIAHQAALDANGKTVAVLGSKVTEVTPHSHRLIGERILAKGAIVSPFAMTKAVTQGQFIARNKVIAGLSDGVLVTEGAEGSGSLYTARFAKEIGRVVMAVPGPITSIMSKATSQLLKQGAVVVTSGEEVLAAVGKEARQSRVASTQPTFTEPLQASIWQLLADEPQAIDVLLKRLHTPVGELMTAMTAMELSGQIMREGDVWRVSK